MDFPSFGDIWEADPAISGAYMMGRTYSMMTGCGIWMHHQGKMDFWSSYKDEDTMRKIGKQLLSIVFLRNLILLSSGLVQILKNKALLLTELLLAKHGMVLSLQ